MFARCAYRRSWEKIKSALLRVALAFRPEFSSQSTSHTCTAWGVGELGEKNVCSELKIKEHTRKHVWGLEPLSGRGAVLPAGIPCVRVGCRQAWVAPYWTTGDKNEGRAVYGAPVCAAMRPGAHVGCSIWRTEVGWTEVNRSQGNVFCCCWLVGKSQSKNDCLNTLTRRLDSQCSLAWWPV